MVETLRLLLFANILVFFLSWLAGGFSATRNLVRKVFYLGVILFGIIVVLAVYRQTIFMTWLQHWFVMVFYALGFSILYLLNYRHKKALHWFPIWLNLTIAAFAFFIIPPGIYGDMPAFRIQYHILHFLFGTLSFTLLAFQFHLLLENREALKNLAKPLSILALLLWAFKIASYFVWADYAWGRYWSSMPNEYQYIIILLAAVLNVIWSYNLKEEKVSWVNYGVLILLIVLLIVPFQLFMAKGHGSYALVI